MITEFAETFYRKVSYDAPVDLQLNNYLKEHPEYSVKCMAYNNFNELIVVFQRKEY